MLTLASRGWCWPVFWGTPLPKQDLERSPAAHFHPLAYSAWPWVAIAPRVLLAVQVKLEFGGTGAVELHG